MELITSLVEKIEGNQELERIAGCLHSGHGVKADMCLNKLYDAKDGNEVLIRCFSETGASKAIVTVLKRGSLTKLAKEQIMLRIMEDEYGIQCQTLTDYENNEYNQLIDEIILECFNIKKA